jgi:hypothetical protein
VEGRGLIIDGWPARMGAKVARVEECKLVAREKDSSGNVSKCQQSPGLANFLLDTD